MVCVVVCVAVVAALVLSQVSGQGPGPNPGGLHPPIVPASSTIGFGQRFQLAALRQTEGSPTPSKVYAYILDTQTGECWSHEVGGINKAGLVKDAAAK